MSAHDAGPDFVTAVGGLSPEDFAKLTPAVQASFLAGTLGGGASTDPAIFHAGRGFFTEAATLAAGPTPPLQQVFNMVTRVNQRVTVQQARIGRLEQGTLAGFRAIARVFGL